LKHRLGLLDGGFGANVIRGQPPSALVIAGSHRPAALAAENQTLQQRRPFAHGSSGRAFAAAMSLLIGQEPSLNRL